MTAERELPEKSVLDHLADESGVAIVFVDESGREVSASNNNSICRSLNPEGKYAGQCAAFCGTALEETSLIGGAVSFTCHAGLECRAIPVRTAGKNLVAIIGRTFLKAENYRRATERATSGDWSGYPPDEFFENILLTGSKEILGKTARGIESLMAEAPAVETLSPIETVTPVEAEPVTEVSPATEPVVNRPIDAATRPERKPPKTTSLVEKFKREVRGPKPVELIKAEAKTEPPKPEKPQPVTEPKPPSETTIEPIPDTAPIPRVAQSEKRAAASQAWRSFFGSLLKMDYDKAIDSILEFLARHYGFSALIWLEATGDKFENTASYGNMKNRKVRLAISPNDPRLIAASQSDLPLELGERPKADSPVPHRTMHLFPIGVGGEISAAIATLDSIEPETAKTQIARICHSIAPQLEILRLRSDVARREVLARAVRRFSESIKTIDADDFWFNLTQNVAEMLQAERASLLVYDDRAEALEIKAIIGARAKIDTAEAVGVRVARIVFARNEAVVISDVSKTGLPPAPAERRYKMPSFLSCPINIGGRTIGVMSFTDRAGGKIFDKASLELFRAIAPQLAVAIDRAALKEKAGEFQQLSVTDALTGLLNRRYIEERLMEEIKRSNRHGFPMSFMMLDVDHFKSYNDEFGHPAGDEALKLVGHVIRETLRGADVAARFGGEEFAILLPQTTAVEAVTIAERIRINVALKELPYRRVTLSIGVASCSAELCLAPNLVAAADKALYEAKRQGRNRVRSFEKINGVGSGQATA